MNYYKKYFKYLLLFILLIGLKNGIIKAQLDGNQKAQWIINNFAPYVNWTNEANIKQYTIGVYGSANQTYTALIKYSKTYKIKGKPFSVVRFKRIKDIKPTNILFVDVASNDYIKEIYENVSANTLLITDQCPDRNHYMINFLSKTIGRKSFEVNTKLAREGGLTFEKELKVFGGSETELRGMISAAQRDLDKERKKLEIQRIELQKQKSESYRLKSANVKGRAENEKQKKINSVQKIEIENQKGELENQKERLAVVQQNLLAQQEKLVLNTNILSDQESKIKEQNELSKKRQDELKTQEEEIEKNKELLRTKDISLTQKTTQIEFQRLVLWVFLALLALIGILAFNALRSSRIRKKINDELRVKNVAINQQKEEIQNQQKHTQILNKELEKLSIVAAKTENAVTIMDAKGNFEWVNVGFTRLYGYTLQLLTHELDENIINASSNPEIKDILTKCKEQKKSFVYESLNKTRSGKEVWIQTSLTPILDAEGSVSKLITIETDISLIKKAETEIRKQHVKILEQTKVLEATNRELEKLSLVASETDNAIAIMDSAGNYQWINEGYSRLFGYSFVQLITEYSKNIISRETGKEIIELIKKCIEEKIPITFEDPGRTRDGNKIWVQTTISPILNKEKNVRSLISISSDISKLKEAEQEIRQQSEELFTQKEELIIQKDFIEQQNLHIKASINYAKTIQNAILPPQEMMKQHFDLFVIFKPKDIVSGDFYWYSHLPAKDGFSEKFFYAAVDCTGHGVPGAFMSMIGNRLLNEIVNEKKLTQPSKILEELNKEVKIVLRQEESDNNDGMDVSLCSLIKLDDGRTRVIFAGAKRPLYYFIQDESQLYEIKGTRKTIGGTQARMNRERFSDTEIVLAHNDLVYLATDGMIDQSSPQRIRFGSPRIMDLLQKIGTHSLSQQENAIEEAMLTFQEHEDQRDDVTFIGIQL